MLRQVRARAVVVLAATVVVSSLVTAPTVVGRPAESVASRYVAVDPTRLVDTRDTGTPLGEGASLPIDLADRVPADATAVVVNLTADAPTQPGYLTVYPADAARPETSSLNKRAGETRSNAVTVALPSSGSRLVSVFNQAGTTQVVVDLFGYYVPTTSASSEAASYYPFSSPFRALDSRSGARIGPTGGAAIVLPSPAGVSGVVAVAVNLTAVDPTGPGYLTAWAGGDLPRPAVSNVNYGYDAATPNSAVVPAYQDGDGIHFTVANSVGVTDVLVDVAGLYAAAGGADATAYVPVPPTRLTDTRGNGTTLGPSGTVDTVVPAAEGDLPRAANVNVTAVGATVPTYVSVYPSDVDRPGVSTLNPAVGQAVPNAAQTLLSAGGAFRVFNYSGAVDVVADLQGYFVRDGGDVITPLPQPTGAAATTW